MARGIAKQHRLMLRQGERPVVTAVVGTNADLFREVARLYLRPEMLVLDMTYGQGTFWKRVDPMPRLVRNDIDASLQTDTHHDFRSLPAEWAERFDAVVLDPPYATRSRSRVTAAVDRRYNNAMRAHALGIVGAPAVAAMYRDGMAEAWRVLKPGGLLFVKTMDGVESGQQQRLHIAVYHSAAALGFVDQDLFVLVQPAVPTMRHKQQVHARKNHSLLWVFIRGLAAPRPTRARRP